MAMLTFLLTMDTILPVCKNIKNINKVKFTLQKFTNILPRNIFHWKNNVGRH